MRGPVVFEVKGISGVCFAYINVDLCSFFIEGKGRILRSIGAEVFSVHLWFDLGKEKRKD